jgi:D-3-phosphoglycerate dehydrogenase
MTPETHGMIGEKEIAQMKDPVFVVNCARGGIFRETDLLDALKSGRIAGAAIDVYENEPIHNHPFFSLENVVVTPHIGANTYEAQERVAVHLVQSILNALTGQAIANAINLPFSLDDSMDFLLPYMKVAEKMGIFLAQYTITHQPIERVCVSAFGEIADHASILMTSFLKGLCQKFLGDHVNYVNVLSIARERQIEFTSVCGTEASDYKNLIKATLQIKDAEHTISGTVFGLDHPRIVAIDDYHIEIKPAGTKLVVKNEDVPGVIGKVGTLLGKSNINIAEYFLSKPDHSNLALAIISLDGGIDPLTLEKLRLLPPIKFAHVVEF